MNIISRGFGLDQSALTRGFDAVFSPVGGGSSSVIDIKKPRKKGPHPISRSLYYDIDGRKLFQFSKLYLVVGTVEFIETLTFSIVGVYKWLESLTSSILAINKMGGIINGELKAVARFSSIYTKLVSGLVKFSAVSSVRISGVSGFLRTSLASIKAVTRYNLNYSKLFIGARLISEAKQSLVFGKKNISNILIALELFDKNQ